MTAFDAPPGVGGLPPGPPWPLELLADLHAGVLDRDVDAALRPLVEADPDSRSVLEALDATLSDLSALPPLRMPDEVAARIDAALHNESLTRANAAPAQEEPAQGTAALGSQETPTDPTPVQRPATVIDLGAARTRRRRLIAGAGILTAAAAVIGVIAVTNLTGTTAGSPSAGGPATSVNTAPNVEASNPDLPTLALSSTSLAGALGEAMDMTDYGPLAGPGRLGACLGANKVASDTKPLGSREVVLDGRPGVLLILPTGAAARFRLLVVGPECSAGRPSVLADTTVGR